MHSNGVSSLFSVMYFHIGRGLYINCYLHNTNLWLSGVFLFMFFMMTGFIGYVITWGQMSFWGGTVITNIYPSYLVALLGCVEDSMYLIPH